MVCIGVTTGLRVLLPQQAEHRTGLGERVAAGLGDNLQRVLGGGDIGADDVPADTRLDGDQGHAVGDHVMQLPSDAESLLDDGAGCLFSRGRRLLLRCPQPLCLLAAT